MSNLQKFNTTLEDFNKEVGKLKAVSEAYQKLQALILAYDEISKKFDNNSSSLTKINALLNLQQEKVGKTLIDIASANTQSKNELTKLIEEKTTKINELQKAQQETISKTLRDIESSNKQSKSELAKLIEEKTDQIRKENKEFYKELETTIKIKLDDNKSEIKQLIESERTRIKEIFEIEFAKNTRELRQVIETETNKQTQLLVGNQKAIKMWLWVIGGLTLILSALAVVKLWAN